MKIVNMKTVNTFLKYAIMVLVMLIIHTLFIGIATMLHLPLETNLMIVVRHIVVVVLGVLITNEICKEDK